MSIFGSRANSGFFLLCLAVGAFIPSAEGAQDPKPARKTKRDIPDEKTIRALIAQLGDDAFDKREAAEKQLSAIGLPALELLRKTAAAGTDLETRERAAKLVEQIRPVLFRNSVKDKDWGQSVDPDGDCRFLLESAAYSRDGKDWKELPPITAELAKTLKVGVIATQNTPLGYEAAFEKLKITVAK